MLKVLIVGLLVFMNASVWAADRPCMNIAEACKKAGFSKDGPEGKDIMKDCVKPIVEGKTIENVSLSDSSVIDACKSKLEDMEKSGKSY